MTFQFSAIWKLFSHFSCAMHRPRTILYLWFGKFWTFTQQLVLTHLSNLSERRGNTPCSKRKYTLCLQASTQNVDWEEPQTGQGNSPFQFHNKRAWVSEKNPSGSIVFWKKVWWHAIMFTKICFPRRLLCYWLTKHMVFNFSFGPLWIFLRSQHRLVWNSNRLSSQPCVGSNLT